MLYFNQTTHGVSVGGVTTLGARFSDCRDGFRDTVGRVRGKILALQAAIEIRPISIYASAGS